MESPTLVRPEALLAHKDNFTLKFEIIISVEDRIRKSESKFIRLKNINSIIIRLIFKDKLLETNYYNGSSPVLGIVDFPHYHKLDYKLTYIFQPTSDCSSIR